MVQRAEHWKWSSARTHTRGSRLPYDPLTDIEALAGAISNWRSMLRHGLEAGGTAAEGENMAEAIEARLRTGRPLAADEWIKRQEDATGRTFRPRKPGPKPKAA